MNSSATSEHPAPFPAGLCWRVGLPTLPSSPSSPQVPTNQHSNQQQHPHHFLTNLIFLELSSLTLGKEMLVLSPYSSLRASSYQSVPSPVCLEHHWDPHQARTFGPERSLPSTTCDDQV